MATPQSIQGLFGGMGTPEEMQRQLIEQKAAQFAEMNQNQQLSAMGYKGGANLGRGIAGAFGVEIQDPTMQRALRLRQLASQYNTNTAKGLRDMAARSAANDADAPGVFRLLRFARMGDGLSPDARRDSPQRLPATLRARGVGAHRRSRAHHVHALRCVSLFHRARPPARSHTYEGIL